MLRALMPLTETKRPSTVVFARRLLRRAKKCLDVRRQTFSPYQSGTSRSSKISRRSISPMPHRVTNRGMCTGQRPTKYKRHMPVGHIGINGTASASARVAKCWSLREIRLDELVQRNLHQKVEQSLRSRMRGSVGCGIVRSVSGGAH